MSIAKRKVTLGLAVLLLGGIIGCKQGPSYKYVAIKGTIVENGAPYKMPPNKVINVYFRGSDIKNYLLQERLLSTPPDNPTSFSVKKELGVAPGYLYQIALVKLTYLTGAGDEWGGKYYFDTSGKSPFSYTPSDEETQEIVIDIGTNTVTKK